MKAAYARYSTDRQTENSIAYQLIEIEKYCAENQIPIVVTFTDEDLSGTNTDRPDFQSMVAAAKAGTVDTVVIYDISRGSRDVSDWFAFRKEMMRHNVNVISATGQQLGDLTKGQDFLLELLTVGIGQVEVLNTRQKSMDGVAVKAKEGKFLGGVPPLGYDVHDGAYVINPQEAAVVRQIFELYARGESYNYILDHIPPITGKRDRPIGKNSLHGILTNERYIGTYTWNKRRMKLFRKWAGGELNPNVVRIENSIPPIIDLDTWEKVCQRRTAERPEVDPAAIVQLLQNAVDNWNPENLKEVLKSLITKIYAHVDGSYTVNVGVHISGKSTARGYNAPCFDGMVHYSAFLF